MAPNAQAFEHLHVARRFSHGSLLALDRFLQLGQTHDDAAIFALRECPHDVELLDFGARREWRARHRTLFTGAAGLQVDAGLLQRALLVQQARQRGFRHRLLRLPPRQHAV